MRQYCFNIQCQEILANYATCVAYEQKLEELGIICGGPVTDVPVPVPDPPSDPSSSLDWRWLAPLLVLSFVGLLVGLVFGVKSAKSKSFLFFFFSFHSFKNVLTITRLLSSSSRSTTTRRPQKVWE